MTFPARLTLRRTAIALDGGTIHILATDEDGRDHVVALCQRRFTSGWTPNSKRRVPGRLYFDDVLLPTRSIEERRVVDLLRTAAIEPAPPRPDADRISPNALLLADDVKAMLARNASEALRANARSVIDFVSSTEYTSLAERLERSFDKSDPMS